ncbi:protein NO VEIN domain-containing protein [Streptomyces sp. NPDC056637]|uniref:protein NO VEIN domain-containing protein n=1 Tax=Streptomyces sp. NPDC056637 TaxID=3345886 RepID=UPI00367F778E
MRCTRGTEERHVEVKGTTGAATSVELTINEALHARDQGRGAPCPQWQKPSRSAQRNRPKHQSHPPLDSRPRHRHRRYAGTDDSHRLIRQRPGRRPPPPRRSRTRPPTTRMSPRSSRKASPRWKTPCAPPTATPPLSSPPPSSAPGCACAPSPRLQGVLTWP